MQPGPSRTRLARSGGRGAACARTRVLYATGFFGGFGFLGFGLLFGVLSPTRHLLLVTMGRPIVWLLAWTACGLRLWLANPRGHGRKTRARRPGEVPRCGTATAAPRGQCPERRVLPIVAHWSAADEIGRARVADAIDAERPHLAAPLAQARQSITKGLAFASASAAVAAARCRHLPGESRRS